MLHKRIEIPKDNYYVIMSKLGSIMNSLEFEDLNKNEIETSKPHFSIINRCDEIESVLNHIDDILINHCNISYDLYDNYNDFQSHLNYEINQKDKKILENNYLDYIQNIVTEDENKIKTQYNLNKQLIDSFHLLLEKKYIYEKMVELFNGKVINEIKKEGNLENEYHQLEQDDEEEQMINPNEKKKRKLSFEIINNDLYYLCGICNTEDILKFRRIIFRGGKGHAIPSFYNATIYDDNILLDEKEYFKNKQIFLIIIQGKLPFNKIKNNLEIFNCEAYRIENVSNIQKDLDYLNAEILQQKRIVVDSEKALLNIIKEKTTPIRGIGKNYKSLYSLYRAFCKREKYIYKNLNRCKELNSFYIGDVWIPQISYDNLNNKIKELVKENEDILLPGFKESTNNESKVRTFFQMDDFVYPFQSIVDTYGIPRYKEVNPGLFSIISFPFLFGIMFGDIGHGLLLSLLSLYVALNYDKINKSNSILKSLLKFRYILLLMGFFSFYCGLIYNDFMAIPLSFFSSCYTNDKNQKIANKKNNCIYPIGIDPKWYAASNDLTFMNSFKMKLSVIIGVIQMTLGIILRGLNNLFYEDYLGFFFEFIPQIIFMLLLFGYMIVLIFIKWGTDYSKNTANAPSIITILMNLALNKGSVDGKPVWSTVDNEERTNQIFFLISIICIPIILLPKPLIKMYQINKKNKILDFKNNIKNIKNNKISIEMPEINNNIDNEEQINENIKDETEPLLETDELIKKDNNNYDKELINKPPEMDDLLKAEIQYDQDSINYASNLIIENMKNEKQEGTFSDIFVHQIIETIEFVLGCVSNTASYLRLWALSLAHSQLSKVFFEKSLFGLAVDGNFVFVIIGYFLFANITISVLMGMDLLEAFLHTLRLHWVEFQNKFYYADGTAFVPYSFDLLFEE